MPQSRPALLLLAIALGVLLVVAGNLADDLVLGRTPLADGSFGSIDAPDVAFLQFVFTSLPMVVLALVGSRSRLLWGVAVALGAGFGGYVVYQTWQDSLTGFAGGANIGLGLIMLASPFLILIVLGCVALIRRSLASSRD